MLLNSAFLPLSLWLSSSSSIHMFSNTLSLSFLLSPHTPTQLSVGLRFSVQRLDDAGPKISFELQIHRWHTHWQSRTLPNVPHSHAHAHKERFVFPPSHVNKFCVCPDLVTVCGSMKLTAATAEDRLPWGQALHNMSTVCFLVLISIEHIARHRHRQLNVRQARC